MFGYVRVQADDLRVREYAYYRAVYCGTCRSMEKNISPLLSFSLRYDFVLLALVRMVLSDIRGEIVPRRCMANPLRRRPMMADNPALAFSAECAAMLTHFGVQDNIADERGTKRILYRMLSPVTAAMYQKARRGDDTLSALDETVRASLSALAELEHSGTSSPDAAAQPFGDLLGAMFAHGYNGSARRIAEGIGIHTGRFIYLCDAADDAPADEKSGSYNPFVYAAKEEHLTVTDYLKLYRERIETALNMECTAAYRAFALCDTADTHPASPCIENIFLDGMPAAAKHVLDMPGVPLSKKDPSKQ
ncbi:MAG: hypothetical protein IJ449_00590 [Clostridia bacterium]|nr:hypothetical protein [Clostridia bacterium]